MAPRPFPISIRTLDRSSNKVDGWTWTRQTYSLLLFKFHLPTLVLEKVKCGRCILDFEIIKRRAMLGRVSQSWQRVPSISSSGRNGTKRIGGFLALATATRSWVSGRFHSVLSSYHYYWNRLNFSARIRLARIELPRLQGKKIQKSRLVSRKSRFLASATRKEDKNGLSRSGGDLILNRAASNSSSPLGASEEKVPIARAKKKKTPKMKEASARVKSNESKLKPKALEIASRLQILYPNPPIPLNHSSPFQLLCAVVLSAQTTDLKVNQVTPELFKMAPDAAAMASCEIKNIEIKIASLGLAPTKAKNLKGLSLQLVEKYGGNVPDTFEALEELPGVGHKTASVVMSQVHGHDAFPVDTHIHRLAKRWGLSDGTSVEQTEADLKFLFPSNLWNDLHLQIIYFGRELCPAKGHDPKVCPICSWASTSRGSG